MKSRSGQSIESGVLRIPCQKMSHFKENWQTFIMNPGPSNHSDLGLPTTQKFRQTSTGRAMKQTWTCGVCRKELSSKRSYTEHMNIHNKTRPFQCEHCTYAAASQMTLHRHKLRNHTPKTEWGYRCPYCEDAFMEPAGYQQHVQQRHPGRSCTYGCPFNVCKFISKSQRHFREHLVKHDRSDKIEGSVDPCVLSNQQLVRYMVNDEIGHGFQRPTTGTSVPTVTVRAKQLIAPRETVPGNVRMQYQEFISHKTIIRNNHIPVSKVPVEQYYAPQYEHQPETYCHSNSHAYEHMHLEQDYDDIDDGEYEEMEDESEDEMIEEYDDGPPILESFGSSNHPIDLEHVPESHWSSESQLETPKSAGVFPHGLVDDELD